MSFKASTVLEVEKSSVCFHSNWGFSLFRAERPKARMEYFLESRGIKLDPTKPAAPAIATFFIVEQNTIKVEIRVFLVL